jgi:hypothetical protein
MLQHHPSSTGAPKTVGKESFPGFNGRSLVCRSNITPINVSVVDLTCRLNVAGGRDHLRPSRRRRGAE